jgi:Ca2+-binding EF-hand superfamily protein
MDADGSGSIDRREFGDAMASLGFTLSTEELSALKGKFDSDGDGKNKNTVLNNKRMQKKEIRNLGVRLKN